MDDTISRQAAIKTALDFIVEYLGGAFDENFQKKLIERMNALPSAQSDHLREPTKMMERKKGKWIKKMRVTETEKYTSYDPDWYCACCGAKYDPYIAKIVNFCYVCGADMRGEPDVGEN